MPNVALPMIPIATPCIHKSHNGGFTLVELAVVLIIVGLLISSLISPLSAQIDQRNFNETLQQINEVREALIGFGVANGRLPRPATSIADGAENPANCADDAACTGFIPWATLGLKKSDAWNKMIRYSVTPAYTISGTPFTLATKGSKKVQTRDSTGTLGYLIGGVGLCSSTPCSPAVIFSNGRRNFGTTEDGTALANDSTTNIDEIANNSATTLFVSRNVAPGGTGGEFDDIVTWIPPYVLMNRMVSAGKLP